MPNRPPAEADIPASGEEHAENGDGTRNLGKRKSAQDAQNRGISRRRALLIGICEYKSTETFSPLKYPTRDVREMRELLIGYGYSSVQWLDDSVLEEHLTPTRENILRAIATLCSEATADDLIWIHFSGHGLRWPRPTGGEARLLAVQDTKAADPLNTAIDVEDDLKRMLRESRARQKVVTLDACQLGYEATRAAGKPLEPLAHDLAEGLAVLTASSSKQYAHESNTVGMGVFTNYLVQALRDQVTQKQMAPLAATANAVFTSVTDWYRTHDRLQQTPTAAIEGIGEILLVDLRRDLPIPEPPADDLTLQVPDLQLTEELPPRTTCSTNYLALQRVEGTSERPVVVATLLSRDFAREPRYQDLRKRFGRNLAALEKLEHEGFARFLLRGVLADAKRSYFATEFLPGTRLAESLSTLRLTYPVMLQRMAGLAAAMKAAHDSGLIHGALTPEKIVNTPVGWKIVDIAVAGIGVQIQLTERQNEPRSPYYPPELTPSTPEPTAASDIYALGCMFDEFLSLPAADTYAPHRQGASKKLLNLIKKMRSSEPSQRPQIDRVANEMRIVFERERDKDKLLRQRMTWLAAAGSAVAVGGLIYAVVRYMPYPPHRPDLGSVVDQAKPPGPAQAPDKSALQRRARDVLQKALANRDNPQLAGDAAERLGWLGDRSFDGTLSGMLGRPDAQLEPRKLAAWALGRSGAITGISTLGNLVKDRSLDAGLWRPSFLSLCLLNPPYQVLTEIGREHLTGSPDSERRLISWSIFAAYDEETKKAVAKEAKPALDATRDLSQVGRHSDLLLALARSPNRRAREVMHGALQTTGSPSLPQVLLAKRWVEAGDPTGIPLLEKLVQTPHDAVPDTTINEIQRLLARRAPKAERCPSPADLLRGTQGAQLDNEARLALRNSLITVPLCARPEQFIDPLQKLLPPPNDSVADEPLLAIHAAASLLEILRPTRPVAQTAKPSRTDLQTQSEFARLFETASMLNLHSRDCDTVLDRSAPPALRKMAARRARAVRLEIEQRRSDPMVVDQLSKAEFETKQAQISKLQDSDRPVDKVVAVLAQHDDRQLESMQAQAKTQPREVQLALAERLQTPQSNEVLRGAMLEAKVGIDALRAYGELRRRGQDVQAPRFDLVAEYSQAGADDRLDLVEAMSGWPFDASRPLLLLATNDGSVYVRRSAVRIIGEAAADPKNEADALSMLRLMFGDADYIVHLYLRAILEGKQLAPSELQEAPAWPPQEAQKEGCAVAIRADDEGVAFNIVDASNKTKEYRTTASFMLPRGNFTLHWLDEKGIRRPRPVPCLRDEPLPIPLPISSMGQLLGLGVQHWQAKRIEQAEKILNDVAKRAPAFRPHLANAQQQAEAQKRAQAVHARSQYFLGKVLQAQEKLPDARNAYATYLDLPAAKEQRDITPDAEAQRKLLESQLGRYEVRLLVDGKCQIFTAWDTPGTVDVKIDLDRGRFGGRNKSRWRIFKNQYLSVRAPKRGTDECKE